MPGERLQQRARGLSRLLEAFLGLLYPAVCRVCYEERASAAEGCVCAACRRRVRRIEPPFCRKCGHPFAGSITVEFECGNCRELDLCFSQARAAAAADERMLDIIRQYKYHRALWFEPFLAGLLIERAAPELRAGRWDLIAPTPLYPTRQRARGFNQAERLGRRLSRATGVPIEPRLLRRVRPTRNQTRLSRAERVANVRGAFALRKPRRLDGLRIALVDDVLTTGSTCSACAEPLLQAGAAEVGVWTVARAAGV